MYRSTVNEVMVRTVALVAVSESKPVMIQATWLKGYAYGYQVPYTSSGIPVEY